MGGVYAANAPVSILFLVLVLAISGVPPFLGFWPKLLLLEAGLDGAGLVAGTTIDWWSLALAGCLLLNALLTLIAGTRIWAHVFWRAGPDGPQSEAANPNLRRLGRGENWFGLGAAALLTLGVVLLGLLPGLLLDLGNAAAFDLLRSEGYVAATGLDGGTP
jgi:multicomponent Na+:H+ antiporter subunit D